MFLKKYLLLIVLILFSGCTYKSKIAHKDVKMNINLSKNVVDKSIESTMIEEGVKYAIKYISNKIDDYEEAHIKTFKKGVVVDNLYDDKFNINSSLILNFKKDNSSFNIPFLLKDDINSLKISLKKDYEKNVNVFYKDANKKFKGVISLNLTWQTIFRDNNLGIKKTIYDGKLLTFTFNEKGEIIYVTNNQIIIPYPSYSIIKNKEYQSKHIITISMNIINTDHNKIIKKLVTIFKDKKDKIETSVIEAYKENNE